MGFGARRAHRVPGLYAGHVRPGHADRTTCIPQVCGHAELDGAAAILLALLDRGLTLGVAGGDAADRAAAIVLDETGAGAELSPTPIGCWCTVRRPTRSRAPGVEPALLPKPVRHW